MFKADRKAAYKQLPLAPADQAAAAALRRPWANRWYGFATRKLICDPIADVLHYDVLPRILTALVNRYLGVPMAGYFDDFATVAPDALGRAAALAFGRFARAMGLELNYRKVDLGDEAVSMGLMGSFPSSANGGACSFPCRARSAWNGHIWPRPT